MIAFMFLIDFDATPTKALVHGFVKGLGAPVVLYHMEPAPVLPAITYLSAPTTSLDQELASDWRRVGADLQNVVSRHGQTPSEQTSCTEAIDCSR